MAERRGNLAHRRQSNAWFEALRTHLEADSAHSDVAKRLKTWPKIEDLLADCPVLLPGILAMAWQLRHRDAFADLFKTPSGQVAESTTDELQPAGKSFEQILLANLQGAMRVYCQRQEAAWLATERKRNEPPKITTWPIIGGLMLRLLKLREQDLLRQYPHHELYQVLKPWLGKREQFGLIEDLAALPTAHARILGDAIIGLGKGPAIRNLAALETRKLKFVLDLARHAATNVLALGDENEDSSTRPSSTQPGAADLTGAALTNLTVDGLHLAKGALAARDVAKDVVEKMSAPLGVDFWKIFFDPEAAANVSLCPPSLARIIGFESAKIPGRSLEALRSLPSDFCVETIVRTLAASAGSQVLAIWATSPECVPAWQRAALDVKQFADKHGVDALSADLLGQVANSLLPVLVSLSGVGLPVNEGPPSPAPARQPPALAISSGR